MTNVTHSRLVHGMLKVEVRCAAASFRDVEKGDEKFFGLLEPKIVLVHDVYDSSRYFKSKNYYWPKYNPLTRASINFDGWAQPESRLHAVVVTARLELRRAIYSF